MTEEDKLFLSFDPESLKELSDNLESFFLSDEFRHGFGRFTEMVNTVKKFPISVSQSFLPGDFRIAEGIVTKQIVLRAEEYERQALLEGNWPSDPFLAERLSLSEWKERALKAEAKLQKLQLENTKLKNQRWRR